MLFHEKYELLALRGGGEEIALPGMDIASGRAVLVHLLAAGYTPENHELLRTMTRLSAEDRLRVVETGDHDGIPYVVTVSLPGDLSLRNWVKAATAVPRATDRTPPADNSAAGAGEFTRLFQPSAVPEAPAPAAPSASAPPAAGEFTRLFQPSAVAAPPPAATPPPAAGEFTRLFQSSAVPAAPPPAAPAATAPRNDAPPGDAEMGELTRLMRPLSGAALAKPEPQALAETPAMQSAPEGPREVEAPVTRPAAPPEPGGLTQLFQAPLRVVPEVTPAPASEPTRLFQVPGRLPAPSPPGGTGEFTRMFRSQQAGESFPTNPSPPAVDPGGFTQMMQVGFSKPRAAPPVPLGSPARTPDPSGKSIDAQDEFTGMFGPGPLSDNLTPPPEPQVHLEQGGPASGLFSRRQGSPETAVPLGPSEFTRISARPSPEPMAAPKPAAPVPTQPVQGAKANKSYLPLVLILGGLFLLAVIVILIVALAH